MEFLKEILFIDIETVPIEPTYEKLTERMQAEWQRKARTMKPLSDGSTDPSLLFSDRAGIFSEFAKVVCIGIGSLHQHENGWQMRLKSLEHTNERLLLETFTAVVERFGGRHREMKYCGHNIKEFDMPFLCRRMVINGMPLPATMQVTGKKPWEVTHIDTLEMWRFGDYKNFTSLSLLAEVLGIPSPKSDLDGSMVGYVFWENNDLERIGKYCLQDVLTSAKVYLRLKGIHNIDLDPVFV